jgi:hypothetical protein
MLGVIISYLASRYVVENMYYPHHNANIIPKWRLIRIFSTFLITTFILYIYIYYKNDWLIVHPVKYKIYQL